MRTEETAGWDGAGARGVSQIFEQEVSFAKQLRDLCKSKFIISHLINQNACSLHSSIKAKTELASSHMQQHMSFNMHCKTDTEWKTDYF